jgi:hypothetical protein
MATTGNRRCFAGDLTRIKSPARRRRPWTKVNQRLALVHPDVASLRRYLVTHGLLTRAAGVYRRAPGSAL